MAAPALGARPRLSPCCCTSSEAPKSSCPPASHRPLRHQPSPAGWLAGWLAGHYPGTTHSSHAGCSPGSHGVADLPEPQFPLLSSRGTGPLMLKGLAPRPGSSSLPLRRVCPAPHSSSICWRFPRPGRSGAAHSPLRPVPAPPSRPPPWLASPVAMSRAPSQSPQAASSRSLPLLGVPPTHPLTLPLGRLQFLYLSTHCAS